VTYEVIFDVREADYLRWSLTATLLVAVLTAIVVVVVRRSLDRRPATIFTFLLLGIVGIWVSISWASTYREYESAASALDSGRASVVQGIVSEFEPMPYAGHTQERFCVEGKCFAYSDFMATAGFNNTSSHGGPIKSGLPVRITFVGNTIIKLEVGQ
jgi:hypothetical protein